MLCWRRRDTVGLGRVGGEIEREKERPRVLREIVLYVGRWGFDGLVTGCECGGEERKGGKYVFVYLIIAVE